MKERVSIVLQRSEKKRSQNARAAASRSSPSSSDKQERAPRDSEIKAPMVNLVLEDGSIDGIHPLTRVLGTMDRSLFTLVMVDPSQDPPVCRIFSRKILYERERQSRKQQNVAVKNAKPQRMVMACAIGDHDLEIKMRKTMDLLAKGRRVTVVIEHKGRQMPDRRKELGAKVMAELQEKFSVVSPPAMEGRMWSVMFQGKP
ncbi:hypothetical protein EV178_004356 [Coemansia sp. RSA 1646]|nr:hypothetical protein EV178_004356 [Coemansia sp. RSA 1646]